MSQIHIWPEPTVKSNDLITVSATIEILNQERNSLWYRLPDKHSSLLTSSCDPFVVATIFMAMTQGVDVVVHGEVSPSLLQNLTEFQTVWACWRSHYKQVEITAEVEREQPTNNRTSRTISTFSGGVDSCFTAFRHAKKLCGRVQRPLEAGLMIHGLDIRLHEQQYFDNAAQKSRATLASLGLELITMATNFRSFKQDWEDVFGVAIASCLMLLQGGYDSGLIPSSVPYQEMNLYNEIISYGSNPITDSLLSSRSFQIIHDGAGFTRTEKVKQIAQWQEALQNLRVCWQGEQKDRNCGHCEKCIRTILNFRVVGLGLPHCFERDIDERDILSLPVLNKSILGECVSILATAKTNSISNSWVTALEEYVRRNQRNAISASKT
ncbi:MAG: hypothetical protein KME30_29205 [Iphinoe sp. HA4291-MV1]|jgi:hypothetical protein|nr:hypothetical protein [Iphinoe sp. HA4291-MV1]